MRLTSAVAAVALAVGGCSVFDPYVNIAELDIVQPRSGESLPFPKLRAVVADTESERVNTIQYRRDEIMIARTTLGLLTFGTAVAAGSAALYEANRDLVLGLGVGAATGYGAGALYLGPERARLYDAANEALRCVAEAGHAVIAAGDSIGARITSDNNGALGAEGLKTKTVQLWQSLRSYDWTHADDQALKQKVLAAVASYSLAESNFRTFETLDSDAAQRVAAASRNVIGALNQELGKLDPGFDTILNAANSVGPLAVSYRKQTPAPAAPSGEGETSGQALGAANNRPPPGKREKLDRLAADLDKAAKSIGKAITEATNQLDGLGTACALKAPQIAALAASQTAITIVKDASFAIVMTGGKLPLTFQWVGEQPGPDTVGVMIVGGRNIVVTGKSGLEAGDPYKLRISDSRAVPNEVVITVKRPVPAASS